MAYKDICRHAESRVLLTSDLDPARVNLYFFGIPGGAISEKNIQSSLSRPPKEDPHKEKRNKFLWLVDFIDREKCPRGLTFTLKNEIFWLNRTFFFFSSRLGESFNGFGEFFIQSSRILRIDYRIKYVRCQRKETTKRNSNLCLKIHFQTTKTVRYFCPCTASRRSIVQFCQTLVFFVNFCS